MNFLAFRRNFYPLACFSISQVYAWEKGFDRNNLTRWIRQGLLVRLRQGYFTFPDYLGNPDYTSYIANRIYRPSYISLHSALAFYGMIPESVVQVTSVTPLKTSSFINPFGEFHYRTIKPDLFFGYGLRSFDDGKSWQIAEPEKALLDLLYLIPSYSTCRDMEDLRLDDDFLRDDLQTDRLRDYATRFQSKALENRVKVLLSAYMI